MIKMMCEKSDRMAYFLKSPIGSLVRALTIFKSSFKYFNLIVISSPCKMFASVVELLLLLSVAFELFDVDCPTSSGLALEMLVDELLPPPSTLLLLLQLMLLLLIVVLVVVVVVVVTVAAVLLLLALLDRGFASRFDGKLFCSALLLLLILLLVLVLPLLLHVCERMRRNKMKVK